MSAPVSIRAAVPGREPAEPVICDWSKIGSCHLCTWKPAARQPGKAQLKLVHAGCTEHFRLDTVPA